mmetsp:Transcript_139690/g.243203  ORF Transcript_139690/g.243203 Transcript_139690/m.243203 type:complete len:124 (-) Transcript_139690:63-434(-)
MTTRTPAVADDFPHFLAWYGQVPTFEHAAVRGKEFHCKDQLFRMRQLIDCRYYLNWHYADHDSYTPNTYLQAVEDWMRCRRIKKMEPRERPQALKEWFLESHEVNSIWSYREPPAFIGKHAVL